MSLDSKKSPNYQPHAVVMYSHNYQQQNSSNYFTHFPKHTGTETKIAVATKTIEFDAAKFDANYEQFTAMSNAVFDDYFY